MSVLDAFYKQVAKDLDARIIRYYREQSDNAGNTARKGWIEWAQTQPDPDPSWFVPYDLLPEDRKEVYRQIGLATSI